MSWGDTQIDVPPPTASGNRRAFRPSVQVAFLYVGIVLPVICFGLTAFGPVDPPSWQSGDVHDYFNFLLSGRASYVFFPLLFYSMVSFCIAVLDIRKVADTLAVQFGVYTGVVLALHFSVVLYVVTANVAAPGIELLGLPLAMGIAILVPAGLWWMYRGACALVKRAGVDPSHAAPGIVFALGFLLFAIAMVATMFGNIELLRGIACFPLGVIVMSSLFCNAYWAFGAYLAVAIKLARRNWRGTQFRLSHLLFVFTWLAAYLAASRASVVIALAEYAKLPTSPPGDCYIATAAARGHRRFVGARAISLGAGRVRWVNRQLVVLKCGELAIRAICPRLHGALRCVYDWLGPRLAARVSHVLLADAVYLSLKPCEWFAAALLVVCVPRHQWQRVNEIYVGEQSEKPFTSSLEE